MDELATSRTATYDRGRGGSGNYHSTTRIPGSTKHCIPEVCTVPVPGTSINTCTVLGTGTIPAKIKNKKTKPGPG